MMQTKMECNCNRWNPLLICNVMETYPGYDGNRSSGPNVCADLRSIRETNHERGLLKSYKPYNFAK